LDELFDTIEDYLRHSVRTGHKQFFNQLWSGFTVPGFLGDVFTSLANTSMYTYEVAPVATLMETELIGKMGNLAGFKDPEGLFLTGGSNGNLQAMMIARNKILPGIKQEGFETPKKLVVLTSREAHYSVEKAVNILGIGTDNVVKITTDQTGRMIPEELEITIEKSLEEGRLPFFINATAGTTVKGAFDPLNKIAPIVRKHNIWFHVDGSFGGTALLSPKHRVLLEGLEEADSFVWNAHKLMGLPLICSIFLVREKGHLLKTNSVSGTDYIFHDEAFGGYDLGPMSLQCGRRVDALKLWLSWKYYGDRDYAERVDRFFDLAAYAEEIVVSTPELELMAPRSSVNVCFQYIPSRPVDLNTFNLKLREELARQGKSFVNFAHLNGNLAIRIVIANHELTREDIDLFFKNLLTIALAIEV
jgi:glutamate/tyrosine decarboxylase-like PLP-dependent enzyme